MANEHQWGAVISLAQKLRLAAAFDGGAKGDTAKAALAGLTETVRLLTDPGTSGPVIEDMIGVDPMMQLELRDLVAEAAGIPSTAPEIVIPA